MAHIRPRWRPGTARQYERSTATTDFQPLCTRAEATATRLVLRQHRRCIGERRRARVMRERRPRRATPDRSAVRTGAESRRPAGIRSTPARAGAPRATDRRSRRRTRNIAGHHPARSPPARIAGARSADLIVAAARRSAERSSLLSLRARTPSQLRTEPGARLERSERVCAERGRMAATCGAMSATCAEQLLRPTPHRIAERMVSSVLAPPR